jgi:acyl carrier protein
MDREAAVRLVWSTIRERAFDGEDVGLPDLPLEATLDEIGFDSLAFVSVVSGLEAAIGRPFPSEFWEQRRPVRIVDLVEAVELLSRTRSPITTQLRSESPHSRRPMAERLGALPAAIRASVAAVARHTFSTIDAIILVRELENLPAMPTPTGIALRRVTAADEPALRRLWPRESQTRMVRQFRSRLASGFICLAAFDGPEVVAIDWLNETDPEGGVGALPGTCLGISLHERWDKANRGIGLSLLAYSLEVATNEGYVRQAAYVSVENVRMRAACTRLLGFTEAGSAHRTMKLGRMHWTWEQGPVRGEGPVLEI